MRASRRFGMVELGQLNEKCNRMCESCEVETGLDNAAGSA